MFQVNIKNLLLASAVAVCAATPSLSQAFPDLDFGPFHPLFGVDGQYRNMEFQEGFGDNLWKETYPQANIYGGLRFGSYFGLVVGHENSKTRDQTVNFSPGDTFLGTPAVATAIRGSSDIKGTYAQIMGYLPLSFMKSTELFLGIGAIHNKLHLEFITANGAPPPPLSHYNETDTHAKVEFGIQKIICNHFGLRVVGGWENTSAFDNLKPVENPAATTIVNLNDTWTVGAGFFWIF